LTTRSLFLSRKSSSGTKPHAAAGIRIIPTEEQIDEGELSIAHDVVLRLTYYNTEDAKYFVPLLKERARINVCPTLADYAQALLNKKDGRFSDFSGERAYLEQHIRNALVAQTETSPGLFREMAAKFDLRGKKIGIANFGGANQFSVLAALKAWDIPADAVKLIPSGNDPARLIAIEAGGLDGTVIPNSAAGIAAKKGMNILANIPDIVKEFPDRTMIMERSFLKKNRESAKRFLQAVSEAIYRLKVEPQLREKTVAILAKRFRLDRQVAEEAYDIYRNVFSFPPRTGRRGLQDVLEIIQQETGRPKAEFALSRFLDESIMDELEHENFFNFK